MSDSEEDSFLSADEGAGDAADQNESSDITLSSDSEPEQKAKVDGGGNISSDITLSSDEDETSERTAKKALQGSDHRAAAAATPVTITGAEKDKEEKKKTESKASETVENANSQQNPLESEGSRDCESALNTCELLGALHVKTGVKAKRDSTSESMPPEGRTTSSYASDQCSDSKSSAELKAQVGSSASLAVPGEDSQIAQNSCDKPVWSCAPEQRGEHEAGQQSGVAAERSPAAAVGWDHLPAAGPPAEAEDGSDDWGWSDKSVSQADAEAAPTSLAADTSAPAQAAWHAGGRSPDTSVLETAAQESPPALAAAAERSERRRPERRERRGPLKLGAKVAVTAPPGPALTTEAGDVGTARLKAETQTASAAASQQHNDQAGWGGWEAWGTSLISSAMDVTKTVMETVETGFGAPDPEEMARISKQEHLELERKGQQDKKEPETQQPAACLDRLAPTDSGLSSWFGGMTQLLGQTSSLVVNTGLDTLEAIGKKTMTVLQEDQLGIHGTIKELGGGHKTSLSQALREAREKRGQALPGSPVKTTDGAPAAQPLTFSQMFDQCDGTVHLEALEMLSSRARARVASTRTRIADDTAALLDMIEELCSPEELEEEGADPAQFQGQLTTLVSRLAVPIKPTRLIIAQSSASQWLDTRPAAAASPLEVQRRAVRAAAEMGAGLAEFLHKLSELLLVEGSRGDGAAAAAAARHLAALATLVSSEAGAQAARFTALLSGRHDSAMTDIYLEVGYLQKFCIDALRQMYPVLQMAVLQLNS